MTQLPSVLYTSMYAIFRLSYFTCETDEKLDFPLARVET